MHESSKPVARDPGGPHSGPAQEQRPGASRTAQARADNPSARPRADAILYKRFGEDVAKLLDDAGISIRSAAAHAGVDSGYLARIVRGLEHPTVDTLLKIATSLNGTLSVRLYPNAGPAIKDRWQSPMLEALLAHVRSPWQQFLEAGVLKPDKGWIDVVLHDPLAHNLVTTELQSELRRLEQMIRWHAAKTRSIRSWDGFDRLGDDPAVSQLLIVRRTRANLDVARSFPRLLRTQYPAHPDDAVGALAGTERWPGSALVWMEADATGARFVPGR